MMKGIDYLKEFLSKEGFRFEEEERFIDFKVQGVTYIAFKNDSSFLQILCLCKLPDRFDRTKALELCNDINGDRFVVKLTINGDKLWCSWEFEPSSLTTSEDYMGIFSILDKVSDEFIDKLNE